MASRDAGGGGPRKGPMSLFGNPEVTWDVFTDGLELVAVTDPYEFPVFYHIGQREDGSWHVLSVEEHDYPLEPWEDQTELERQLARVRSMRVVMPGDEGWDEAFKAMDLYVDCESPDARLRADERWERVQANVARELAEAAGRKPEPPRLPHVERKPRKRGLFGGLFLTFCGKG